MSHEYLKRTEKPSIEISDEVTDSVTDILRRVREGGDEALHQLTSKFDGVEREQVRVSDAEIEAAREEITDDQREAIDTTIENVRAFHSEQRTHIEGFEKEFQSGITLGQRIVPVESAGVYIPGGRYPLVAAPAMTIVPAVIASVDRIIACAPPQEDGSIYPSQLYAMDAAGADEIYCVGGAQAIGAMAYGTESIDSVDHIGGPGNVFTTEAKRQVYGTVGIDFLAGPSEVLILADETADAGLVATDLLAQAEHDANSRPILVTTDETLARETMDEVEAQLPDLRTEEVARECWDANGEVIVADTMDEAVDVTNEYAMEHLQVMTEDPRALMNDLYNYGSLFLGEYSPVVFGDKTSGTNHSLPTLEISRYSGGIWVGTYLKTLTHQEATREGGALLAENASKICEIEGTHAHQLSAEARKLDDSSE